MRRQTAQALYEIETESREDGWPSEFVYDAEHDPYRFSDGEFASLGSMPTSDDYARPALSCNACRVSFGAEPRSLRNTLVNSW
jgi:hypothetical protein